VSTYDWLKFRHRAGEWAGLVRYRCRRGYHEVESAEQIQWTKRSGKPSAVCASGKSSVQADVFGRAWARTLASLHLQ